MRLVVAGNVEQFLTYRRSYGNNRDVVLRYVRDPEDLDGLLVQDYVLIGSWRERRDIEEILKILEANHIPNIG